MGTWLRDLRHAVRVARQSPGFTLAAVAALALGIGANSAIFSVVDAVLLKPLPYPDADRLVVFVNTAPEGSLPQASPNKFNLWRRELRAFAEVSAYRFTVVNWTGGGDPEQLPAGQVSADFFRLFGAPVVVGRTFQAAEDLPNGGHVVVLAEGFWRRRFGGDPAVLGRALTLDGAPHTVIGVLGRFDTEAMQSDGSPDVWLPFQIDPASSMQGHYFTVAGRLRPGVAPATARDQLRLAAEEYRRQFPDLIGPQEGFGTELLQEIVVRDVRRSLWVLSGAVGFVLLIACANVANLLLIRATARQREIAVRAALGAGRGQIVCQLLTESLVLSALGGALGLALGLAGIRALIALHPGDIPRLSAGGIGLDWRVLAFTVAVSLLTGLLFGLFPALHAAPADLSTTLKEGGGRSGSGLRQNRLRAVLVVAEVALALVLLVGASLLVRTLVALRSVDTGFDARRVLVLRMSLTGERFAPTAGVAQVIREGLERLASLPGVEVAGASCCVPLQDGLGLPFVIEGRPLDDGPFHGGGGFTPISPTYFRAFGIPLLRGRGFTDRDDAGAPDVVIINQTMARQFWPQGDPLTGQISIGKGLGPQFDEPPRQIVGVVGDVRDGSLAQDPQPTMYVPWAQLPDAHNVNLVGISPLAWIVRTRGEPYSILAAARDELRQASGGLPVAPPRTMEEIVGRSSARSAFNMTLLLVFAGTALLLAAIGIYGLMAYSVQQRTQEIGIRAALGASAGTVRSMILVQGMRVALLGVVLGMASAFGLTRVISSLLFGVTSRDPAVFVAVPLLLLAVALVGVWLPARRAARVDPATALRAE